MYYDRLNMLVKDVFISKQVILLGKNNCTYTWKKKNKLFFSHLPYECNSTARGREEVTTIMTDTRLDVYVEGRVLVATEYTHYKK